jgi:hypothetical protein
MRSVSAPTRTTTALIWPTIRVTHATLCVPCLKTNWFVCFETPVRRRLSCRHKLAKVLKLRGYPRSLLRRSLVLVMDKFGRSQNPSTPQSNLVYNTEINRIHPPSQRKLYPNRRRSNSPALCTRTTVVARNPRVSLKNCSTEFWPKRLHFTRDRDLAEITWLLCLTKAVR